MSITDKKFSLKFFLILAGSNLAVYILYHISYLLGYNWFEYVRTYAANIWEFLLIPITVVIMLQSRLYGGQKRALKLGILASIARIFYSIPYYYMEFMRDSYPPNSTDSIILALLFTLVVVILTFVHLYLIYGIVHLLCHLWGKGDKCYIEKALSHRASFDFSSPASVIFLYICLVQFFIKLIGVVGDTISFLSQYGAVYTLAEILTLLLDYVICLGMLVLSYLLVCRVRDILQPKGE